MNSDLLTIDDICRELGIGRNKAYTLVNTVIKSAKIGRRIVVHKSELEKYITGILKTEGSR